jgi:hypothetical protein
MHSSNFIIVQRGPHSLQRNFTESDSDTSPFSSGLTTPADEALQPFDQVVVQRALDSAQDGIDTLPSIETTAILHEGVAPKSPARKIGSLSKSFLKAKTFADGLKKSAASAKVILLSNQAVWRHAYAPTGEYQCGTSHKSNQVWYPAYS